MPSFVPQGLDESREKAIRCVLAVNGGFSSIKFAVFDAGLSPGNTQRLLGGSVERIGMPGTLLTAGSGFGKPEEKQSLSAKDHPQAATELIDWLRQRIGAAQVAGIGHRVVHGGMHLLEHQLLTNEVIAELKRAQPLDLAHLPREIALIEAFGQQFPGVPQVACLDTAFHRDMPRVAQRLPIPRRYGDAGVRRFGFHGLSYAYLMDELRRIKDGGSRVILAHLGSGASMAAVRDGKPIDTTMAFTPTAGLVMGTRPGDFDPGLLIYLMRTEKLSPEQMDKFINEECGLLAVAETGYDMRDLIARRAGDVRAAEAVELFCYQAKKFVGAYAAALGGLDTLVFAGGIGEHAAEVRAGICESLDCLGLRLDARRNTDSSPVISAEDSRVTVRIIRTDEEIMIARIVLNSIK